MRQQDETNYTSCLLRQASSTILEAVSLFFVAWLVWQDAANLNVVGDSRVVGLGGLGNISAKHTAL